MTAPPPTSQRPSTAQVFARQGFVIVNRLAPEPVLTKAREHLAARAAAGTVITDDEQVPGTPSVYGGIVLDGVMEELRPVVEHCTGLRLHPTYSYGRLYRKGDTLPKHRDRSACEISVSLNLSQEPDEPWPLHVQFGQHEVRVRLKPGDALLYRGIELPHWREPYTGECLVQIFLHYVDQDGPYAEEKFDRRPALAMPFGTRMPRNP
ncbi:MAG TPA: hypothetical protein VMO78_00290 [Rhizomicrobium sp.]|nr:hypothetical protein [Rhizomicrobium sp.]